MAHSPAVEETPRTGYPAAVEAWLDRPLAPWGCALGWVVATFVFVGLVQLAGGPSMGDDYVSTVPTWAIAHGQLVCAYPPGAVLAAPLYPFVSGAIAAAGRIGHGVPFPSAAALGPRCDHAFGAISAWGFRAGAVAPTLRIGYTAWVVLLAGAVAVLRACGRGRRRWEPFTLLVLACLPPVWLCLENFFHPQDVLAMGLALVSVACARRGSWVAAGVAVALAALAQQFALLVAAPLLVLAPARSRWSYAGSAAGTALVALVTLQWAASGSAVHAVLVGTGDAAGNGTVVSGLHLHGAALLVVARLTPLVLAVVLAWWVRQRMGRAALEAVPLLSLVALCLCLRLVFDQYSHGYYYMALAVTLVLLDVAAGHVRGSLVAWLLLVSVVFVVGGTTSFLVLFRVPWGHDVDQLLPPLVAALGAAVAGVLSWRGRRDARIVPWLALALGALLAWPSSLNHIGLRFTSVFWQIVLVLAGLALAATPLLHAVAEPRRHPSPSSARGVSAGAAWRDGILR